MSDEHQLPVYLDVNVKVRYDCATRFYTLMLHSIMAEHYSISELAQEFGVTARTIRHYEDQGLLRPQRSGLSRVFSNRDRARLKLALRSKRLGFSLSEIRELFELYDVSRNEQEQLTSFLAKLDRRRALLEQQREDIDVMLNEINFFSAQCRRWLKDQGGGEA